MELLCDVCCCCLLLLRHLLSLCRLHAVGCICYRQEPKTEPETRLASLQTALLYMLYTALLYSTLLYSTGSSCISDREEKERKERKERKEKKVIVALARSSPREAWAGPMARRPATRHSARAPGYKKEMG